MYSKLDIFQNPLLHVNQNNSAEKSGTLLILHCVDFLATIKIIIEYHLMLCMNIYLKVDSYQSIFLN